MSYHEGEIAVQRQAGVEIAADKVGAIIRDFVPPAAQAFLESQRFLVLGAEGQDGRLWASPLTGPEGFAYALDDRLVQIDALPGASDPLAAALRQSEDREAGLLAIEFATRRRMRVNGSIRPFAGGLEMRVAQAYSNCPKYIQARTIESETSASNSPAASSTLLNGHQKSWIERADTLFIASIHPERGADASHRGGASGFLRIVDDETLLLPDYSGNNMFNTYGNLAVDPRVGLLFIDFEAGHALHLSGTADLVWDKDQLATLPGAERALRIHIESVIERSNALSIHWGQPVASPFNP